MNYQLLVQKISNAYNNKIPFVVYSLAESEELMCYLQNDAKNHISDDYSGEGFIFAPFDNKENAFIIPSLASEIIKVDLPYSEISFPFVPIIEDSKGEAIHSNVLKSTLEEIQTGRLKKVVISRKKEFHLVHFNLEKLLERILATDSSAFRYVWYHPKTGLWCGASPEVLLKSDGNAFYTMALAGTQKFKEGENVFWTQKERDEQKIVTQMLMDHLENMAVVLKVSKTYNRRAGSLLHICTDVSGTFKKSHAHLKDVIAILHPTPAVCGTPKEEAKKYILDHEDYHRSYYTGFLGTISTGERKSDLYVNLRCMHIEEEKATLFVGGGITKDSQVNNEWKETQNKLQTMLQVLEPML